MKFDSLHLPQAMQCPIRFHERFTHYACEVMDISSSCKLETNASIWLQNVSV